MKRFVALCLMAVALATAPAFSADIDKGVDAYNSGDYKTALREFQRLAEQGHAKAQYNLGQMYREGQGVPQDYKKALKWYRLSAEQGYANAQYNLALLYTRGEGVLQDYKESVKWWRLSAEQGNAKAQGHLGWVYRSGEYGVLQDYVRAHMWYNIAASNGGDFASGDRDSVAKDMTPAQIVEAQDLARKCVANNYQGC